MGHTDRDLTFLKMSTAGLSLIGSLIVLCTFYLRPLLGQFKYINISVVILSLSGTVMYILYFIIPNGESLACMYQGAIFQVPIYDKALTTTSDPSTAVIEHMYEYCMVLLILYF